MSFTSSGFFLQNYCVMNLHFFYSRGTKHFLGLLQCEPNFGGARSVCIALEPGQDRPLPWLLWGSQGCANGSQACCSGPARPLCKSPSQHGHCLHSQDHRPTDGSCWVLCRDRQSPGCEVGGHTRQQGRGGTRQPCTCLHKPGNSARHSPDKWSGLPHPSEVVTVTVKDGTYFLSHFVYLIYNLQCRRVGWGTSPVPLPVPAACWERASRQHIEVFSW
jgi:hypothetical protein